VRALQSVGRACEGVREGTQVEVLPLDLCGAFSELQEAAARADDAFEGAGVDYLMHNAGEPQENFHSFLQNVHLKQTLPKGWCLILSAIGLASAQVPASMPQWRRPHRRWPTGCLS
jgi:hypothetical protein